MTKATLHPEQRRAVEIIERLGFGEIEGLSAHAGLPWYEPEPGIVQAIKLDSAPERQPDRSNADLPLKIEFERLFDRLRQLREGVVDLEVRHGTPFRLVVKRRFRELL
jgi:hypothetical protein